LTATSTRNGEVFEIRYAGALEKKCSVSDGGRGLELERRETGGLLLGVVRVTKRKEKCTSGIVNMEPDPRALTDFVGQDFIHHLVKVEG
jgi:hypothetical protein